MKIEKITVGFFSARLDDPNAEVQTFLKLCGSGGVDSLFIVYAGDISFGNRWVDDTERLNFYDVRMMDATLSCLRYTDRNWSAVKCDISDVEPPPKAVRLIEV